LKAIPKSISLKEVTPNTKKTVKKDKAILNLNDLDIRS